MTMKLCQVALFLLLAFISVVAREEPAHALETISTSDCSVIRHESYKARLDIFYLFMIEWKTEADLDIDGVQQMIAEGLVDSLSECDSLGRPRYAVQISKGIEVGQQGKESAQGCFCRWMSLNYSYSSLVSSKRAFAHRSETWPWRSHTVAS